MKEVILVALNRPETAPALLAAARAVAGTVANARIVALAVRLPVEALIMPTEEALTDLRRAQWQERESARVAEIEQIYWEWTGVRAGDTEWIDLEAIPAVEITERGRRADLVIIGRPPEHPDEAAREILHAALFETHRPVLVVPPGFTLSIGRKLAIAWRDDGRAIKAVIPALRYFAGAEISALIGYRGDEVPTAIPAPLAERGIAPKTCPLAIGPAPFGETLLKAADVLGADLLVMGAYVHRPLREMLLGGVTRHVLAHAEIPVLMRH